MAQSEREPLLAEANRPVPPEPASVPPPPLTAPQLSGLLLSASPSLTKLVPFVVAVALSVSLSYTVPMTSSVTNSKGSVGRSVGV